MSFYFGKRGHRDPLDRLAFAERARDGTQFVEVRGDRRYAELVDGSLTGHVDITRKETKESCSPFS